MRIPAILALFVLASVGQGRLPNIVFILADDMSYDSVSALNPAIGPLKTPHIDRLVSQGIASDAFAVLTSRSISPNGGQFDFVWLSALMPRRAYV